MKFFLYYFNYSEFNLENSDIIFWRLYYTDQSNESTTTNQNSLIVMTDFIHHFFKRGHFFKKKITALGSDKLFHHTPVESSSKFARFA